MPVALASLALENKPGMSAGQGLGVPRPLSMPMYYDHSRIGAKPNEMVHIPAGQFIMGTDERLSDEGPQHTVHLKSYWVDKYEVTNLQYKQFVDATARRSPDHFINRSFPTGKADHPVTFVSWHDAKAYCAWAGKRLPTDEEWEKAARGTDGRMFPWGNQFDINKVNSPVRWGQLKVEGDTTPVGAFPEGASPYGLHDVSGNVWEWTDSWYRAYPGNKKPSENYGEQYKTLKGGSWWDCSFYKCGISAPVFNRAFFNAKVKNASFGFRCAKDDK
ncbi:MAG: formylglycine-generating enzyme family protein [Gammaproteobacteria bacterium]|nr:formylglycine-generating enzyme family protein [Gammaproteobacteria bacterium]